MAILSKLKKNKNTEVAEKASKVKEKAKVVVEEKTEVSAKEIKFVDAFKIILKPVLTEKSTMDEAKGKYAFIVSRGANKIQIKKAIQEMYGILPVSVKTLNFEGKVRRFGRNSGRRSDFKKAVVTLPKGKTISIHEGV